jgi:hypothetical protein
LGSRTGWTSGVVPALDLGPDLRQVAQLDPFVVAEVLDDDTLAANPDEVALERWLHAAHRRRVM